MAFVNPGRSDYNFAMHRRLRLVSRLLLLLLVLALAGCGSQSAPTPAATAVSPGQQTLYVLPDDGPEPLLDWIDAARTSIRIKIYVFTDDAMRDALIRAANRGVDVRVLIDPEPVGGGEGNMQTFQALKDAGVRVKWASGPYKHYHEKSIVIDDRRAIIATFNFTYSSFTKNREFAVVTTQPDVVADVAQIFDADWAGEGVAWSEETPIVLSPVNSRARLTALIEEAQQTLWLEEATLLDDDLTQALVRAAQRGVDVRFLAPRREDNLAEKQFQRLQQAGATIALLDEPYVHAKAILVDGRRAFIGSVNLSFTSLELNRELGIITEEPEVVSRLAEVMARDWARATARAESDAQEVPVIDWRAARQYVGKDVIVQGTIVRTYDSGKVTFLNFDDDYRNTLTIVLFPSIYDAFPEAPASYFLHQQVWVRGRMKLYEGSPEIVIHDPSQIRRIHGADQEDPKPTSTPVPESSSQKDVETPPLISWEQAGDYLGQVAVVEGQVVQTYHSGKAIFLDFHEDWKGKFKVVIFARDAAKFPQSPEKYYLHQRIRVRGKITSYKGAPEIIVSSPDQIAIIGEGASADDLPAPTASAPPKGVVPWEEAGRYVGQTITVEGRIVRTKDIGSLTFLDFSEQKGTFVVIVRSEDYARFPQPPAELYRGKQVWVTGVVSLYRGTPQMIIHSPEQIEVFH